MKSRLCIIALGSLVVMAVSALAQPAHAQGFRLQQNLTPDEARDSRKAGKTIPVREAVKIVRQRYDVRELLNAYTVANRDGSPRIHVVRIITGDGRRLDVQVNAQTGRIESAR